MAEPPRNLEAERALLAAMLADPACIDEVTPILGAGDFHLDAHQKLFQVTVDLAAAGKPIDFPIAFEELRRRGQADDVGGPGFLAGLFGVVTTGTNAVHHATIIRDCATRRRILHLAAVATRDAAAGAEPAGDLLAALEGAIFALGAENNGADVTHVRPVVAEELDRLDALGQDGRTIPGITTGFADLDAMTGGWQEGLYLIGARPSVGKSAMMLSCALAAVRAGVPALIFSLEMSRRQLVQRHLAMLAGTNLKRMRGTQRLRDDEAVSLNAAAETLARVPLFVSDAPGLRPSQFLSVARRMVRREGVRLIFIDYAQLMEPDGGRHAGGRVEQLETISRGLKLASRSLGIPVVALAQLNRVTADRGEEKPRLHDFKGSGSFEQDADDAYLLWRIEAPEDRDVWTIGLDVAKQRNGPTGEIRLAYRRSCTRFEDHAAEAW